jgi:hypothetical protein
MPRPKGTGKGSTKPISIRLPPDEEAFYRRKANEHGVSLSAFLAKMLVAGVVAENIQDVEERMRLLIDSITKQPGRERGAISDDLALSIITCEALLTSIVEAQDTQVLYSAQEAARARMKKLRGA